MKPALLISCEHASNAIPKEYVPCFSHSRKLLSTHQGWDIGALTLYQRLCKKHWVSMHAAAKWSRQLVDLNRSLHHPKLFSSELSTLSKNQKSDIIKKYYLPYRTRIIDFIKVHYKNKLSVLHLSIHSFSPQLNGRERQCDLGLLYDPKSAEEKLISHRFKAAIQQINSSLTIRMNYPYLGIADGLTSFIRKQIPRPFYAGIEIEMNQKHFDAQGKCKTTLINDIVNTINYILQEEYATFLR